MVEGVAGRVSLVELERRENRGLLFLLCSTAPSPSEIFEFLGEGGCLHEESRTLTNSLKWGQVLEGLGLVVSGTV